MALIESLARVPANLFSGLDEDPEQYPSCPVSDLADSNVRIICAFALDTRLQLVQDGSSTPDEKDGLDMSTPEIRLETESGPSSPTKDGYFDFPASVQANGDMDTRPRGAKTLSLASAITPKSFRSVPAHPLHVSALLRILHIHKSLNLGSESPNLASMLVPLYVVMTSEADPTEVAHAEADTFWLFEALLQEVSELEESEGGAVWMSKLKDRLRMTDNELLEDLVSGLSS